MKLIGLKEYNTYISVFDYIFFKFPKYPYRTVKLYLYLIFQTPRNINYMRERSSDTERCNDNLYIKNFQCFLF